LTEKGIQEEQMHTEYPIHEDPEDFKAMPSFLNGIRLTEGPTVPVGYFEMLPDLIEDRIADILLMEQAPILSSIPKVNPFGVPDGYFEQLPDLIRAEILLSEMKHTETANDSLYFRELPADISSAVILEDLNIQKTAPYPVPADYFDWLPSRIADRIAAQKETRFSWAGIYQWLQAKYLVPAACMGIFIAFFVFNFSSEGSKTSSNDKITFSEKDKKDVLDNIDFFGFEEGLVMDHIAQTRTVQHPAGATEQDATIDYLLENTDDPGAVSTEN
jgi:hypothetical protein